MLYLYAKCEYNNAGFSWGTENILSLVDSAINLGYLEAPVFSLRAEAHYERHNLGLALSDVNGAINMATPGADLIEYLCLKAAILVKIRNYTEACNVLSEARKLSSQGYGQLGGYGYSMGIEATDILYQLLIPYEYGLVDRDLRTWGELFRPIVQYLTLATVRGEYVREQDRDSRWRNVRATVAKTYSLIANAIKEVVGEDFWQANRQTLE